MTVVALKSARERLEGRMPRRAPQGTAAHITGQLRLYSALQPEPLDSDPKSHGKLTFGSRQLKNTPSPLTVVGTLDTMYRGTATPTTTAVQQRIETARKCVPVTSKVNEAEAGNPSPRNHEDPFRNAQLLLRLSYLEDAIRSSDATGDRTHREIELLKHLRQTSKVEAILDKSPDRRTAGQQQLVEDVIERTLADAHRIGTSSEQQGDPRRTLPGNVCRASLRPLMPLTEAMTLAPPSGTKTSGKRLAPQVAPRRDTVPFAREPLDLCAMPRREAPPPLGSAQSRRIPPADVVDIYALRIIREMKEAADNGRSLSANGAAHLRPLMRHATELKDRIAASAHRPHLSPLRPAAAATPPLSVHS